MKSPLIKTALALSLAAGLCAYFMPRLLADDEAAAQQDVIDLVVGDIQTVQASGLTRVSVTNPDIADISDAKEDKVSLLAKRQGKTILFLWDANGKRTVIVQVINEELGSVKARLQKILAEANITGVALEENPEEGKVVVSGSMSKEDKDRLNNVLAPYSEGLLNLVKTQKDEDLIQVDMEVVEIQTNYEKSLGILWGSTSSGANGGGGSSAGNITLNYNETLPQMNGHPDNFFKIGNFRRTTPLEATVQALIQDGKARLISKPRLVAVSGKQASFLVGGEIPIETTTTNTTGSTLTQNTSYAQYGVNMMVTPTIRGSKIDVLLNMDIRDIDAANSSNGNVAFITRNATTDLLMENKQTIVLAGLIKYSDSKQITKVPFLGDIPVLGLLFRSSSYPSPTNNTEMVIILTPTVLTEKKFEQKQLIMPTPEENKAWNEIDGKYPHEAMHSEWPHPKSSGDETSLVLPVMTAYARTVQEKISRAIAYPPAALGQDLAGTVKLKLHILKDGSLDSEELLQSSGSNILDQDAMQAARSAAPFDAFASGMDQDDIVFTIPIVYNRMITQGQAAPEKVIASY